MMVRFTLASKVAIWVAVLTSAEPHCIYILRQSDFFDTTPYISTANHYEYFDIVDHALRLVDFKSSTIPFLFLGTLIQQS